MYTFRDSIHLFVLYQRNEIAKPLSHPYLQTYIYKEIQTTNSFNVKTSKCSSSSCQFFKLFSLRETTIRNSIDMPNNTKNTSRDSTKPLHLWPPNTNSQHITPSSIMKRDFKNHTAEIQRTEIQPNKYSYKFIYNHFFFTTTIYTAYTVCQSETVLWF